MLLLMQWASVALALDDTTPSTLNPITVKVAKMPKIGVSLNKSETITTTIENNIIQRVKTAADLLRGHNHKPPPPTNLTGPLDLKVNTTTPTSITLQWRLNKEMEDRIIKYRIHYRHQNFPDVKTILPASHGTYELTGLGK